LLSRRDLGRYPPLSRMQQPADAKKVARVLPVPVSIPGRREVTREEIEEAAKHNFYNGSHLRDNEYDEACITVDGVEFDLQTYITAAFRCSFGNQVYVFMDHEYLLLKYDPTTLDGGVIDGPKIIRKGIPSLADTVFGSYGIYCAFGLHHRNEAFIFSGHTCARISYAPDTSDFKILEGPTLIDRMFPFLIGTSFENHVDAAFESATDNEAYLFRGIEYAVINYQDRCMISDRQTFDCLKDTVFQSGIDAAFASHVTGEAFIFKDEYYALINFVDKCIIGDVKKILPDGCPSLSRVLPRKNICHEEDDFEIYPVDEQSDEDYY